MTLASLELRVEFHGAEFYFCPHAALFDSATEPTHLA